MNVQQQFNQEFLGNKCPSIERHPEFKRGIEAYLNHEKHKTSASYEFNAGWEHANQLAENAEKHERRIAQ
jgi:hypothetical protein|tara:strand:+ start:141 stop:350 length:210 start_codon:yes stop_codon:yes gene_type:complete